MLRQARTMQSFRSQTAFSPRGFTACCRQPSRQPSAQCAADRLGEPSAKAGPGLPESRSGFENFASDAEDLKDRHNHLPPTVTPFAMRVNKGKGHGENVSSKQTGRHGPEEASFRPHRVIKNHTPTKQNRRGIWEKIQTLFMLC